MLILRFLCAALAATAIHVCGSERPGSPPRQGGALLKTDLMFVGAHPDDETGIAATLARYAGLGKTVAAVYATRGEGGGNMVGTQAGPALGVLREVELRDCLTVLGVRHVYFLDEEDFFYTESVAATLEKWNKEDVLGKLVRVIRSLRPDVVITMNPAPNPGQHGHHQAAGVLATEAFNAAADAKRFPEQLEREGLEVWQVRKLYYSGNAEPNVKIRTDEALPGGKVPADLAAQALVHHRSQAFGNFGNSPWLRRPSSFVLAKTAVEVNLPEKDLLEVASGPVNTEAQSKISKREKGALAFGFVPRPAIARFQEWAREQQVDHTASAFVADVPVVAGKANELRFQFESKEQLELIPALSAPQWTVSQSRDRKLKNGLTERVFKLEPVSGSQSDVDLTVAAGAQTAKVRLHSVPLTGAYRLSSAPDRVTNMIPSTNIVQGRAESAVDVSAQFAVGYDRDHLTVLVDVTDDTIVSNIAPNDIKGHWRSDSVEICIDPNAGSEHTLNTFKLGIFPFDSTGVVRGARDGDANQGPIERVAPAVKLTSRRTGTGYFVAAQIPWKEIGAKPRKGLMLGFNIIIYDGDKKDAAPGENINEARIAWSPRPGVQGRPEDWGRLVLQ